MFPLIAENLVVEFNGKHILGPLDLTVNKGDISLILGPNGSGKTTLLKSLHGIMKLKRGSIKWSCSDNSSMKKQMFVFQTPIMLRRSVFENLTYPLLLRKVSNSKAHRLATEWAEKIGLKPLKEDVGQTLGAYGIGPGCYFVLPILGPTTAIMHISATRLSGGEKQKLALARALITEPEMLFLDEPSASLDGKTTVEIENLLKSCTKNGTTIMMSTHDIGQAKRLAKNILFLNKGILESNQLTETFFLKPMSPNAQKFITGEIVE